MSDLFIGILLFLAASVVINTFQYWELCKLQDSKDQNDALIKNMGVISTEQARMISKFQTCIQDLEARALNNMYLERENRTLRQTVQRYQDAHVACNKDKTAPIIDAFAQRFPSINQHHPD